MKRIENCNFSKHRDIVEFLLRWLHRNIVKWIYTASSIYLLKDIFPALLVREPGRKKNILVAISIVLQQQRGDLGLTFIVVNEDTKE